MPLALTLTFDNGPVAGVTEHVLDVLARRDVAATFFVVGERASVPDASAIARRALAEGHRVGGHTWSHSVPFGPADDAVVDAEIERTAALVAELGGDPLLFRPYGSGGTIDDRLMSAHGAARLRERGMTCVLWNSLPGDWYDEHGWRERAVASLVTRPWSVLALHDLPHASLAHLDEFIAAALDLGARFTLDTPDDCTPIRAGRPTSSYQLLGVGDA